ncbi:GDSL-type esterase/lipase family protein [Bacillus sp. 123MFChir2]|uniref:GDSL-type esterase/lipase family protein n=1 Tax=Bacillus sp. 123MFChir2 TaxID=1169144 RepID=UPI000379788B|nr:GDSL-type esterase/lipase family protein [Bacillus sp. 123MFChir2]
MKKLLLSTVCLLLLIIIFLYCDKNHETNIQKESPATTVPHWVNTQTDATLHHLVLGDSLAKGYGSTQGGYVQVASHTLETQLQKQIIVDNLAVNGLTTDRLLQMLQTEEVKQKIKEAHMITISIGGNNVLHIKRDVGVIEGMKLLNEEKDHFEQDLQNIVKTIRAANPNALIVLSELYNPLKLDDSIASYANVFLDNWNKTIYSISKENQPSLVLPIRKLLPNDQKDLLYDQVHPNDKGYEIIAESFAQQVLSYNHK